jgi:glycosyltransferase involved in cell wall biosynthesis
MMDIFINAFAASAGGGLTYVRNIIPWLGQREDVRATVLVSAALRTELASSPNIEFVDLPAVTGAGSRFWLEQRALPDLVRRSGAQVLLSTGNFALWNSPVPQILLSRNSLYTSADFENDLRRRGDYGLWLDTHAKAALAKASIRRADVTVAPSAAFAEELRQWTGKEVVSIHHGFDAAAFTADQRPLRPEVRAKLDSVAGSLRLLFVSHYNYYRNFETLIRALPRLRDRLAPRKARLLLTCELRAEANPGFYQADSAAALVESLGVRENVIELGTIPYAQLHQVYRSCDVYVTPAYAESFAHPLVEAMCTGLPVIASDIKVHREICADAALYFERFTWERAADLVMRVARSDGARLHLSDSATRRYSQFSWERHVDQILTLTRELLASRPPRYKEHTMFA